MAFASNLSAHTSGLLLSSESTAFCPRSFQSALLSSHGRLWTEIDCAHRNPGGKQTLQHSTQHNQQQGSQMQPADPRQALPLLPVQQAHLQQQRQQQQQQTRHYGSRAKSLARALQLHPSQTAQMMREYPALANFNHGTLADKTQHIAGMLQLPAQHVAAVLVRNPRVLGAALHAIEARIDVLVRMFGSLQAVQQLVLQDPTWLAWSPKHLANRLQNMALCLGTDQELLQLMLLHPQLLYASRWLVHSLRLIQQLLQLSASRDAAVYGTTAAAAGMTALPGCISQQQLQQQQAELGQQQLLELKQQQQQFQHAAGQLPQQQQLHASVALPPVNVAAVRRFALQHPHLLLTPPDQLQVRIAVMQAQSGLSLREVAAAVVANPHLLYVELSSGSTSQTSSTGSSGSWVADASGSYSSQYRGRQAAKGTAEVSGVNERCVPNEQLSSHDSSSSSRGRRQRQPGKQYWQGLG